MDRLSPALAFLIALCIPRYLAAQPSRPVSAGDMLRQSGVQGGLVVHVGCGDATWTVGLRVSDRYIVQGLEPDPKLVDKAQRQLLNGGHLGPVTVHPYSGQFSSKRLPYTDNLVNLLIVEEASGVSKDEALRMLAPGGVGYLKTPDGSEEISKPWPEAIDEWTHFLHGPDNNAVADDTRIAPPQHLQWTAGPRWGRSHDQLASVSAVVSAAGRIFSIVDEGNVASVNEPARWLLVARDAFNGILLWKRPVGPWENHLRPFRSGPAEVPRRLVAVGDRVFVTLGYGKPVTALDAATGETIRTYPGTNDAQEILFSTGRLFVVAGKQPVKRDGSPVPELPEWLVPYPQSVYTQPPKHLVCLDAKTADVVWTRRDNETANLLPLTLATSDRRLFFHNEKTLVALDAETGKTLWTADRPVSLHRYAWSSPTVVVSDGIVLSGDRTAEEKMNLGDRDGRTPRWLISSGHDLFGGEIIAFSAETGEKLWTVPCHESFNAPVDVFVVRGQVWSGQVAWTPQPGITQVYNLKTGKVVAKRPPDHKFGRFGHHRCYRAKATVNYVLHSRRGIEFVDMSSDELLVDRWLRGTCQYGILPCNGMIYTPPHACACYVTHQLNSFCALAPGREPRAKSVVPEAREMANQKRLERGPAFDESGSGLSALRSSPSTDWPMYRKDAARSGATEVALNPQLARAWGRRLGGRLTPPVVADGRVFLAKPKTHTVHALDAANGAPLWHYSAGAPVDSPPTAYGGFVYFGSADGWVYCLRGSDGSLAWRYRAAPTSRQIVSYERLESVWPVHGSVLVHQPTGSRPTVYGVAGRSTYLDGGMVLFGLDALTGKQLFEKRLHCPSPESKARTAKDPEGTFRVNVLPDVLSTDGTHLFMRNQAFGLDGTPAKQKTDHLFSSAGFLDDSWWHRTYWQYGTDMSSGYRGWITTGNRRISGRILVQRGDRIIGYGRKEYRKSGSHAGMDTTYHLFSAKTPRRQDPKQTRRGAVPSGKSQVQYDWSVELPFYVRAMALAADKLIVAGPTEIADLATAQPDGDVWLWVLSAEDGKKLAAYRLPASPVFDSLAVSDGSLLLTTVDGQVIRYRSEATGRNQSGGPDRRFRFRY